MKCNYCGTEEKVRVMGVSGAYDKEWKYCKEHYLRAKVERDAFLVKKKLPVFDRTRSHEEYYKQFCADNVS